MHNDLYVYRVVCYTNVHITDFQVVSKCPKMANRSFQRVHSALVSAIISTCKEVLDFDSEVQVEGLLGITVDQEEIFLVNVNSSILGQSGNDHRQRQSHVQSHVKKLYTPGGTARHPIRPTWHTKKRKMESDTSAQKKAFHTSPKRVLVQPTSYSPSVKDSQQEQPTEYMIPSHTEQVYHAIPGGTKQLVTLVTFDPKSHTADTQFHKEDLYLQVSKVSININVRRKPCFHFSVAAWCLHSMSC